MRIRTRYGILGSLTTLLLNVSLFAHASVADELAPSIVQIAFQDHVVTISASPRGPLYSVRTRSGEILGEGLTDEELLAAHPKLAETIRSGYASDNSGNFIWAGRDESLGAPPEPFDVYSE